MLLPKHKNLVISNGTLKPEDLAEAFFETLSGAHFHMLDDNKLDLIFHEFPEFFDGDQLDLKTAQHSNKDQTWVYDEQLGYLIESLDNCLNQIAPEGCIFGASEGDGASFGFWETEDN